MNLTFTKNLIAQLARDNFDIAVKMSLKDYHVQGFQSIILLRDPALTLRLYVSRAGETHLANSSDPGDNTLLIHNHAFDFQCQTLKGWMRNLVFEEAAAPSAGEFNHYLQYRYESALLAPDGKMRLRCLNPDVNLALKSASLVAEGESYFFTSDRLHRILVPDTKDVIMLFWEHAHKPDHEAILYSATPLPETPDMSGLYNPYTRTELAETLSYVLDTLPEK